MKILHLIYDYVRNPWVGGGGAVRVYELSRRLAGRGHEITVVSGRYPGAEDYDEGTLRFRFVGSAKSYILSTFSYALSAARLVRQTGGGYDLVIEDFAPWNPVFSRFLTKTPTVLHVNHREGLNILKRWGVAGIPFYMIEALYPRLFKRVTALSEGTRAKIKRPDAEVVPAGINGSLLEEGEGGKDGDYAVFVGRLLIKNKGLDTLFEAMKALPGIRLLVVGKGRDEAKLKAMGLKNVEFAGFVSEEEKIRAVKDARLLVLPSRFEGWGIVVLEAAACGKPVVVSGIPELSFAVEGGFGLSFRPGDAKDLGEKMRLLYEDGPMRAGMGQRARRYVKDYTWESIARRYEALLPAMAGGGDDA